MSNKKHTAEEIINKLLEAEVLQGKGQTLEEVVRQLGISSVTYLKMAKRLWRSSDRPGKTIQRDRAREPAITKSCRRFNNR